MHCESKSHLEQAKLQKSQPELAFRCSAASDEGINRTTVELQMAVLTVTSNVPLAV